MYEKFEGVSGDKTRRLDISIDCLKLMLQNKIFNNKTHEVGLILFGAEEAEDGKTIYI
jgi:ATP-dependent DNA helicase 2 subunit 2